MTQRSARNRGLRNRQTNPQARKQLEGFLTRCKAKLIAIERNGPRYLVARVLWRGKTCLLKFCLYPRSVDRMTNDKFSREVLFLKFLKSQNTRRIYNLAPHLYDGGAGTRAWYLREYLNGETFTVNNGNIRFKKSFFTEKHLKEIIADFSALQRIRPLDLPKILRKEMSRSDSIAAAWQYITPQWKNIARLIKDPSAARDLPRMLRARQYVFDHAPYALSHQEPYATHFIKAQGKLRMIDWENINWSSPLYDYSSLWMRASEHPAWQKKLHAVVSRRLNRTFRGHFQDVWETDLLIKALFNAVNAPTYPNQADFRALKVLSHHIIREQLATWRKKSKS